MSHKSHTSTMSDKRAGVKKDNTKPPAPEPKEATSTARLLKPLPGQSASSKQTQSQPMVIDEEISSVVGRLGMTPPGTAPAYHFIVSLVRCTNLIVFTFFNS